MVIYQFEITSDLSDVSGPPSQTETTMPLTHLPVTTTTIVTEFQCKAYPIPLKLRCDGIPHCPPDHEDEKDCPEGNIYSFLDSSPVQISFKFEKLGVRPNYLPLCSRIIGILQFSNEIGT